MKSEKIMIPCPTCKIRNYRNKSDLNLNSWTIDNCKHCGSVMKFPPLEIVNKQIK